MGSELKEGSVAPEICLPDQDGKETCLSQLKGDRVVLYFYPKDSTSGCTQEAKDFTGLMDVFKSMGVHVLGVSPDSCASHRKFIDKEDLRVRLLSDGSRGSLETYGVWARKSMYGKEYMGVERSTFLIGPDGRIERIWRKVKVDGHAQQVLDVLRGSSGN